MTGVLASALIALSASGQTSFSDGVVTNISLGTPVLSSLGAGDFTLADGTYFQSWAVSVSGPSLLSVELASVDFDPFLAIALPDDTIVDFNDDCFDGNSMSPVSTMSPPSPGLIMSW